MRQPSSAAIPLQSYLMQLFWLGVLPLLLLAAGLAYHNVQTIRATQDEQAQRIASNFASTVDQELRSTTKALLAVAQSPHLERENEWSMLYEEAKSLQATMGVSVAIIEPTPPHRMRLNTLVPFGQALPATPRSEGFQAMPAALETLKPAVGDRLISAATQREVIAVAVPAIRNGKAIFAVASPVAIADFQKMIDSVDLPEGWALTLQDGIGQTLAQVAPPGFQNSEPDATDRFETASTLSRWKVVLQVPRSARYAPIFSSGGALVLLVLAATLAGALGSRAGSQRLGKALTSLTQNAAEGGQLAIQEIDDVGAMLENSAARERASETRFRRLFQDAPVGMRLTDPQGQIVAQNARFEELFGYSIQDVPNLDVWLDRAYPDPVERNRVVQAWGMMGAPSPRVSRRVLAGEFRITTKSGEQRVVQVRGSVLPDGMLSSFADMTDQRQTEARLRLWAEAFEHAELNLSISDSHTNTLRTVNPAFAKLHGYERAEMQGMPVAQLFPENGHGAVADQIRKESGLGHFVLESEHIRKDGSRFPVQLDVTVLRDAQGVPVSRLVYATDLTERKRIEAEIKALQGNLERRVFERTAQLSRANKELDSFAYTVSHDLRAPLRAMDGFLHLLREEHGDHLPEDAQVHLDKISAAILRMKNLIEGILTLTHSARHDLQLAPVDLSDMVSKQLKELASADPSHPARIDVQPHVVAAGDARMLEVVVSNLVGNAWKYTAKTQDPSIRFYTRQHDGQTWYCLADNGAGFDQSHAEKLFQPFQRMHRHDEFPGIGIGLATVQRIILRHGGQIEAQASPGQGATFHFTLNPSASDNHPEA